MYRFKIFCGFLCILLILTACQPTPETSLVQQKGDLQEKITETEEQNIYAEQEDRFQKTWELSENNKYEIDAVILGKDAKNLPVYKVWEDDFQEGEPIREITERAFSDFEIYKYVKFTKEYLTEMINEYATWLDRYKKNLNMYTGEPLKEGEEQPGLPLAEKYQEVVVPGRETEMENPDRIDNLNALIEETQEKMVNAPSEKDLEPPDYEFYVDGSGEEEDILLLSNDEKIVLVYKNWGDIIGNSLMFWSNELEHSDDRGHFANGFATEEEIAACEGFAETKAMTDELVKNLSGDYLALDRVMIDAEKNAYRLFYTRKVGELKEAFVANSFSPGDRDSEEEYMPLWGNEFFVIETLDGKYVTAEWNNRSEVEEVVSNAAVLPWEDILKTAEKQLEYIVSLKNSSSVAAFDVHNDIVINRIELAYTKLLVKDSGNEYQLIPVWNFSGYDRNNTNEEICFVTVNAIDGTAVNRAKMY